MDLNLTTMAGPSGERVATRLITVSGPNVPRPGRLRQVAFVDGRWVALAIDAGDDPGVGVESAGDVVVGSIVTLDGKRMRVETRAGSDPELVDVDDSYYGEPSEEPERVAAAAQQALGDGLAALEKLRELPSSADAFDADAAAASVEAMSAFCAAVTERKPWPAPVGTDQAKTIIEQLTQIAYEAQQVAELTRSAAEAWEDTWEEVTALVDAARTGASPDGRPELRFDHFDDEPEPEPDPSEFPLLNLTVERHGWTGQRKSPAVHKAVRKSKYSIEPLCGASASARFAQTSQRVTCGRCLYMSADPAKEV